MSQPEASRSGISRILAPLYRRPDEADDLRQTNHRLQAELDAARQRIAALEKLSHTDELTGLSNRRGFDESAQRVLASSERHGEIGVLALFDLDGFKAVNDTWGHAAGDTLLRRVADILYRSVRTGDCVGRLHGDEFAVLLNRCGFRHGLARMRLVEYELNTAQVQFGDTAIPIRASMGIVRFEPGRTLADLMRDADRAMYSRKRESRKGEVVPFPAR